MKQLLLAVAALLLFTSNADAQLYSCGSKTTAVFEMSVPTFSPTSRYKPDFIDWTGFTFELYFVATDRTASTAVSNPAKGRIQTINFPPFTTPANGLSCNSAPTAAKPKGVPYTWNKAQLGIRVKRNNQLIDLALLWRTTHPVIRPQGQVQSEIRLLSFQ